MLISLSYFSSLTLEMEYPLRNGEDLVFGYRLESMASRGLFSDPPLICKEEKEVNSGPTGNGVHTVLNRRVLGALHYPRWCQ